jgi:hypothetical protein
MPNKVLIAFGAYAVLAVLAAFTLEGQLRLALLVLLAGLAAKTWIGARLRR